MILNKLTKFAAGASLFAMLALNSTSAFADGGYVGGAKKCHKKKPVHTECVKPCETPMYEPCAAPKKECMEGMTFGIYGDFGIGINSNSDFKIGAIATTNPATLNNGVVLAQDSTAITFAQKRDSAYGGGVTFGWTMMNGLEAYLDITYKQIKNKSSGEPTNTIQSDVFAGMIGINYYIDLFNGFFLPFVGVAGGIARTKAKGTLRDRAGADFVEFQFNDLTKTRFCYQVMVGVATSFDNAIVGIDYKFFGTGSIDDSNSDITIKATDQTGTSGTLANPQGINFGSLTNNVHFISVFVKFLF